MSDDRNKYPKENPKETDENVDLSRATPAQQTESLEPMRETHPSEDAMRAREGVVEKSESIWQIYLRRFKKHTLGKVGLVILLVLYFFALFADFFSPYSMTYRDKTKPYHPPSALYLTYRNPDGGTSLRAWTFEQYITNRAFRTYGNVPRHTVRAIARPTRVEGPELRSVALQDTAAAREAQILRDVANFYRVSTDDPAIGRLEEALRELEASPDPDARIQFGFGTRVRGDEEIPLEITLAKGNKNFVNLFARGIPISVLGLFETDRHFLTSPTGGFFIWGTDGTGRDLLSRLMHGGRVSLTVGLLGAAITFVFGLAIGGIAGYAGGVVDNILMRLAEVVIAVPGIYLLFALRAAFPPGLNSVQRYLLIVVILSGIGWAGLARIIRGLVLSIKSEDYVLSAKTMGLSHWKIIRKHVLPNTFSFTIIQITLTIPGFILGESALSLLGLGITEPQSSWGLMLAVGRNFRVVSDFPWMLIPGVFIFLAILAWNFFGDGIRDSVDPRSKH